MRARLDGATGKVLLKALARRLLPAHLLERPKMGFGVPMAAWLRGPLRDWAEELLCRRALQDSPWLDATTIVAKWQQHLQGSVNWHPDLWTILVWQMFSARR